LPLKTLHDFQEIVKFTEKKTDGSALSKSAAEKSDGLSRDARPFARRGGAGTFVAPPLHDVTLRAGAKPPPAPQRLRQWRKSGFS
jgi:hypothetical protein